MANTKRIKKTNFNFYNFARAADDISDNPHLTPGDVAEGDIITTPLGTAR